MEILNVKDLSFSYPISSKSDAKVLDGISFSLDRGDFLLVAGSTGSGKSTLLRTLKRELTPEGTLSGEINFFGKALSNLSDRDAARRIGFVSQYPEEGIVTDKVWHELAFGLENLGTPQDTIRRRTAEMAAYFGIEEIFDSHTDSLSGGEKQLLSLAAVMTMDPDVLILDEPTSRLDPIAASEFIDMLAKLNRDFALTVIIVEHRLEELIPVSNKILALDGGKLTVFAPIREALPSLLRSKLAPALPAALRIFGELGGDIASPVSISEGRVFIENSYGNTVRALPDETNEEYSSVALMLRDIRFRYSRHSADILCGLDLTVYEGECLTLLGGNGSGKSTFLRCTAGLLSPYSGNIKLFGKKLKDYKNGSLYKNGISLLPQDVKACFLHDTVKKELDSVGFDAVAFPVDLSPLYDSHPYDISGGEMQLVALAKAVSTKPRLLMLDEPTKGFDAHAKDVFINIIRQLKCSGMTVIIVTHDTELAAELSDRVAMLFRGAITSVDTPRRFFSENRFFTTSVSRMTRGYYDNAVTVRDAVELCRKNGRKV